MAFLDIFNNTRQCNLNGPVELAYSVHIKNGAYAEAPNCERQFTFENRRISYTENSFSNFLGVQVDSIAKATEPVSSLYIIKYLLPIVRPAFAVLNAPDAERYSHARRPRNARP